jgi:hypothetical protein
MKKAQLERLKGAKIESQMRRERGARGETATPPVDRKEQRTRDRAAGLVPFAVKLSADLVKRIHALAQQRQVSLSEVTAELLEKGLGGR